jgi:hypothetical protein
VKELSRSVRLHVALSLFAAAGGLGGVSAAALGAGNDGRAAAVVGEVGVEFGVAVLVSPLRPAPGAGVGGVPGLMLPLALDLDAYRQVKALERVHLVGVALDLQRSVDLEVERFEILAPDATLIVAEGDPHEPHVEAPMPRPDMVLLRGRIVGQPQSAVYLSLSPHGSHGFLRLEVGGAEQTYIITSDPTGVAPTVIYNLTMLPEGAIQWQDFACGVREAMQQEQRDFLMPRARASGGAGGGGGIDNLPCRRVRLAVDTDWEYTQRFSGNTSASQAYILTLLAAVSEIYVREVNTRFEIVYTRVWSNSNDPYTTTTINDRLNEFRSHWNSNMGSVSRNLAHMLSGIRSGAGGVAWLGVICSSSYGYGISGYINGTFPYPLVNNHAQNWDVMVAAHEIGHNFKAPHTHSMSPPVDGCGNNDCSQASQGTIMSYCHTCSGGMTNIRLDLHPRVINEQILPYLNGLSCNLHLSVVSISTHPVPRQVNAGQSVQFSVQAGGSAPLSYRWQRNGLDLSDGGAISGATTSTLTINPAATTHAGEFSVRVSNLCGSMTSSSASLTVLAPCYANCDQSTTAPLLNVEDFSCFINRFAEGQLLGAAQQVTHYANCDNSTTVPVLNVEDFTCFINKFAAGCP